MDRDKEDKVDETKGLIRQETDREKMFGKEDEDAV